MSEKLVNIERDTPMLLPVDLMRGKEKVSLEWNLVCSAYNMKRLFNPGRTREGGVLASEMPKISVKDHLRANYRKYFVTRCGSLPQFEKNLH